MDSDLLREIVTTRASRPAAIAEAAARRPRRTSLVGETGRLMLIAADHPARGALRVGDDPLAMADRSELLRRLIELRAPIAIDRQVEWSVSLADLLRALVDSQPELEIRILIWSIATVHAPGETLPLIAGAKWQEHPRIHLRLDREHPIYGAHHQKIVCIDDWLAGARYPLSLLHHVPPEAIEAHAAVV